MGNIYGIVEAESYSDAEEVLKKQEEYKQYVDTHIENVKKAYNDICNKIYGQNDKLDTALSHLKNTIVHHDESKYGDEEFEPYRKNFYPLNDEEKKENEECFELAWKHHYGTNSHHPEHWVTTDGRVINMPVIDILEMICDWESFKYIGRGSAKDYWNNPNNRKEKSQYMSSATIKAVDYIISLL